MSLHCGVLWLPHQRCECEGGRDERVGWEGGRREGGQAR